MGTVMLLSFMASSIALSLYFMWKAFSVLPDHLNGPAPVAQDTEAADLAAERVSAKSQSAA